MIKTLYRTADGQEFNSFEEATRHEEVLQGNEYEVELHFTGCYSTVVRAHSEEEAFKKANEEWEFEDLDISLSERYINIVKRD